MPLAPPPPGPSQPASFVAVEPNGFLVREVGSDGGGSTAPLRFATLARGQVGLRRAGRCDAGAGLAGQGGWRLRLEIEVPDPVDPLAPPALLPWMVEGGTGRTGAAAGGPAGAPMAARPGAMLVRADLGPAWCWGAGG